MLGSCPRGRALSTRQNKWLAAIAGSAALLSSASCGQLIGLGDDYYEVPLAGSAAGGGFPSAGASPAPQGGSGGLPDTAGNGGVGAGGTGGEPVADAGRGGMAHLPGCDLPMPTRDRWKASSLPVYAPDPPSELIGGNPKRWSTGRAQTGGEWFQIDFGATINLRRVNLQQGGGNFNDYPRAYRVVVSDVALNFAGEANIIGVGTSGPTTTIVLPQITNGRYLLIEQTDYTGSGSWWSVDEAEFACY